jgi:hypothetical protein
VCGTLSAVFPLVVIAVIGQRSTLHLKLRRLRLYRASVRVTIVCSLMGLVYVVIGQQAGGLLPVAAGPAWFLFVVDVVCLGLTVIIASVTSELEEERDEDSAA